MSELEDADDDRDDAFLRALAWTPEVAPFAGTARYRVDACLGEGGFGVVYEVLDRELGRPVALKLLKPQRAGYAEQLRRLKAEFRSVADLVHPNLVGLHELASDGTRWFVTMELVRGRDFAAHVRTGGAGALRAALAQLVTGVAVLHDAGIIHRDLKPSNVLIEDGGRVVILDFGLAAGDDGGEPELVAAGTPQFMAPEQAAGGPVTVATDWYAVGAMLREGLEHVAAPELEPLCEALLRADPAERAGRDELAAQLGDPALARPPRREAAAELVGRGAELQQLRASYARLVAGEPGIVRVHGEPGVGKTALVARFLDELRGGDALVLASRCHEREAVPYKAFDGASDALVAHLGALPEAGDLLPADAALVAQLFPAFEALAPARAASVPADRREARLASFAVLAELLARLARRRPVVIAIDDLQWSDLDSAHLLAHLVAAPRPRVLFVLAYRAGGSPVVRDTVRMLEAAGDRGSELAVEPLPAAEAEALAAALLGADRRAAAARIAERGEGHPLFIAELARAGEGAAAGSLVDVLWQRVSELPADARALLETVAVAGEPVPAGVGYDASGLGARGVDVLRRLRAEHLVRSDDGGALTVYHDRIREAVLERGEAASRRDRHLALARALEAAPAADSEALARHYDAGGEPARAATHAVRAGDAAMAALAFDRAAAMYRMALERGVPDLHEKLGTALDAGGYNAAAGEAFLAGAEHATGEHAIDLTRRGAEQLLVVGDIATGLRAIERALAGVGERLPRTARRARLEMLAHVLRFKLRRPRPRPARATTSRERLHLDVLESAIRGLDANDPVRAIALRGRYSRHALAIGDPRHCALALINTAFFFAGDRPGPTIDELLADGEAIGRRIGDPGVLAQAELMRGMMGLAYCDWGTCAEHSARAAQIFAEQCVGMANDRRLGLLNLATAQLRMGRLADARRVGDALLLDATERGDPVSDKNVCAGILGALALVEDDVPRARELIARAATEDRCVSVVIRAEAVASLAAYDGCPADGVHAWRVRWRQLEDMGVMHVAGFRMLIVRSLGSALVARATPGDLREARRLARSIAGIPSPCAQGTVAQLHALRALHDERTDDAARWLTAAADHFDAAQMPFDAAACRHRRGRLLDDPRTVADAESMLRAGGIVRPERWAQMIVPR
jgi:eukaryotic-like serine/threonine-protein kinase